MSMSSIAYTRLRQAALRAVLGVVLGVAALPAAAQDGDAPMTGEALRAEISDTMDAIASYTEQEREAALSAAGEAIARLDALIESREQALRENWADMSEAAQETAEARMQDLRSARNRLGERYGALEAGAETAWDELRSGFSAAWEDVADAWSAGDDAG